MSKNLFYIDDPPLPKGNRCIRCKHWRVKNLEDLSKTKHWCVVGGNIDKLIAVTHLKCDLWEDKDENKQKEK